MLRPYTDMRSYLEKLRGMPKVNLSDDECQRLLDAGESEVVFYSLLKIPPFIVQKHVGDGLLRENYQDMIQEGNIALLKAIDSWKPFTGMSISSWGYMYAKKAIIREVQRDIAYYQQHDSFDFDSDQDTEQALWKGQSEDVVDHSDDGEWERVQEILARYRSLRKRLSARDKTILDMVKDGENQETIAATVGLSQSRISRVLRQLYNDFPALERA